MWSNSRKDTFEVYYIPAGQTVNGTEIRLNNVTGGNITLDYFSDVKVSGSIDFAEFDSNKQALLKNSHVRVYYLPSIAGKVKKYELCTGYVTSTKITWQNGAQTGTIEFSGELLRYTADKLINTWTMAPPHSALEYYKGFNNLMGNAAYSWVNFPDIPFRGATVLEIGSTPMKVLQVLADYTGCEVIDDPHGRIVMNKYIAPDKKPITFKYPTGNKSIMYGAIEIEDTSNGTPNRYVVYHQWADGETQKMLRGIAQLPASNPISAPNQNRWITEVESIENLSPKTQEKINQVAQTRLKTATQTTVKYTFNSFFAPFRYGDVIQFSYDKYTIDAIVENMTIDLVPGATMKVTAREIRKRG